MKNGLLAPGTRNQGKPLEKLLYQLKSIRLSGMANALRVRLQKARACELPYLDFVTFVHV